MAKSRYFMSSDLKKLEDAHVCFRYWSGRVYPLNGAPVPVLSVIKQKIKKNLFATVNKDDYVVVSDPETGKLTYHYENDFDKASSDELAKLAKPATLQSEEWIKQKLGNEWFSMVIMFITRFARKQGILPAVTKLPLITMALSKDDWKDVKAKCLKFEVVAFETAQKLMSDGMVGPLHGYTVDMAGDMLDREDKAELANCVKLIEVDKNGAPLK